LINKIKSLTNTEDKKRLLSNFFSLSVLQGANYILPLITLPYLVRVLGVEYFGLLAFATATVTYFSILTDYGFNLTATREISIHRDNKAKVIEIFSSVMTIKVILMFVSFLLLSILIFSFEKFSKDALIYFLTFGTVVGQVLFPVWFFQGMERMKYITYLNILSKLIFTIAIFVFVREQSDFYLVPLLTSVGFLVAGVWSLYLVKNEFGVRFELQTIDTIKHHFIEGWHVFIAGLFTLVYTISIPFILGIFTNNTVLGYFSIAEKIIKAINNIYVPLNQAVFPYVNNLISKSKLKAKSFLLKLLILSSAIMFVVSILVFIYSSDIILLISGKNIIQAELVLKILSILPLIITIARILSFNYIISFGYKEALSRIYFYSAIISLPMTFILIPLYEEVGASVTMIVIELFATFYMLVIVSKKIGFIK